MNIKSINGLVIWTAIIALATFANFWVGFNIKQISESSLKLNRAFIGLSSPAFIAGSDEDDPNKKRIKISLPYKNYGPIPSRDINITVRYFLNNDAIDSVFADNISIFPNETYTINKEISKQNIFLGILSGLSKFKVESKITYCDPNGDYDTNNIIEYFSDTKNFKYTYSDWN